MNSVSEQDVAAYVAGLPLGKWLEEGPRPWQAVLRVFMQVGDALAIAHDSGVIHQDVKVENVVLAVDGGVVLRDLKPAVTSQLAKGPGGLRTAAVSIEQRLAAESADGMSYLSPEEYRGGNVDARANQFSFCVAFYRALYGQLPYEHERSEGEAEPAPRRTPLGSVHFGLLLRSYDRTTIINMAREVLSENVRRPPEASQVPVWLEDIVRRGLRADPADRYPSIRALLDDIARHGRRRKPAASAVKWRPWIKWGAIAFGVGLVLVLAAFARVTGWLR